MKIMDHGENCTLPLPTMHQGRSEAVPVCAAAWLSPCPRPRSCLGAGVSLTCPSRAAWPGGSSHSPPSRSPAASGSSHADDTAQIK